MLFLSSLRRKAILTLILICLLVCTGLGWATWAAVRLERVEIKNARARSYDEIRALAMSRLDGLLETMLGAERNRPYDIFRSYYKPAKAYDPRDWEEMPDPIVLPSPLQTLPGPDWLLLHFQASVTQGWSSPQLDENAESAISASEIPADKRRRLATAANWLAALRSRYDPWSLLDILEEAQIADIENRQAILNVAPDAARDQHTSPTVGKHHMQRDHTSRTAAEFARRGARILRLQRHYFSAEQCEPQLVALDNLQMDEGFRASADPAFDCVQVYGTPMLPLWLDLTLDNRLQLALVRTVSVERSRYCTLQGVLIDWSRLRQILEADVQDLLPGARIEPVPIGTRPEPDMLHSIPVRLVSTMPIASSSASISIGLKWGLVVAWSATFLALLAIIYGIMKYVTLMERRMNFVAAVTHELRTPLTSFQLYTDLLAKEAFAQDNHQIRAYIHTLSGESKRLARLVENVLVYSKIEDAKPELHTEPIAPQSILDDAASQTADICQRAGKQLVVENRCDSHLQIRTDRPLIIQILANLIDNACKYSDSAIDSRIWLTAGPSPGGGISFEVEDAGTGVSLRDRKAIFHPFRRGNHSQESGPSGLGLGLALSKYWAGCLEGRLTLKRAEHNSGPFSRFVLWLPKVADESIMV